MVGIYEGEMRVRETPQLPAGRMRVRNLAVDEEWWKKSDHSVEVVVDIGLNLLSIQ